MCSPEILLKPVASKTQLTQVRVLCWRGSLYPLFQPNILKTTQKLKMALQSSRHFKTKLNSQLKHSAAAQDTLCWHKVIISLPQCLLTALTQISSGRALLELSPSSWVRILRTFHSNNPRSFKHKNSFFHIVFCLILFFFLSVQAHTHSQDNSQFLHLLDYPAWLALQRA